MTLSHFQIVTACIVGILSMARTARLLAHDSYPPVAWLRAKWDDRTDGNGWNLLLHCQYCMTPYMAPVMFAWFWFSDAHWTWWVINGLWAASYLAAIVVSYDQPPE